MAVEDMLNGKTEQTVQKENNEKPLVSVGIPVRDGAKSLRAALDSVIYQTYQNLEIIISDNCSSDETKEICLEYAEQDNRITYIRQEELLSAIENFRFVYDKSHGKYFMWAAHDDIRDDNYIETLLKGFGTNPLASIVFSDYVRFNDYSNLHNTDAIAEEYLKNYSQLKDVSFLKKHLKQQNMLFGHIYGLINSNYLYNYPWFDIESGPDVPLTHWLLCYGDFIYVSGTTFYYYHHPSKYAKSIKASQKKIDYFLMKIYHAWICAFSIKKAESNNTRYRNIFLIFIVIYSNLNINIFKKYIKKFFKHEKLT